MKWNVHTIFYMYMFGTRGVIFRKRVRYNMSTCMVEASRNVMAHEQKPDLIFRRNGRVHLNRWGRQFSRLLAVEVCASAVVMLDTPCSEVVWRVLATHCIRQFPLHFPSRVSPCTITFQLENTAWFTKVWFCIGRSSLPVGGRSWSVPNQAVAYMQTDIIPYLYRLQLSSWRWAVGFDVQVTVYRDKFL